MTPDDDIFDRELDRELGSVPWRLGKGVVFPDDDLIDEELDRELAEVPWRKPRPRPRKLQPRYKPVHDHADKLEPRLARALRKAFSRMRERAPIADLAAAIDAKDVRAAVSIMTRIAAEDALVPASSIHKDAFKRGGRTAGEMIR